MRKLLGVSQCKTPTDRLGRLQSILETSKSIASIALRKQNNHKKNNNKKRLLESSLSHEAGCPMRDERGTIVLTHCDLLFIFKKQLAFQKVV